MAILQDMEAALSSPPKGRPREFCVDEALAAALRIFWKHGYEGASLTDLTQEMGITRPSLYAAFGNKEALFRKAFDLYEREKLAYVEQALAAPTSRAVAERLLGGALDNHLRSGEAGCLSVNALAPGAVHSESVRMEIFRRTEAATAAIVRRFERARAEGDLPAAVDPAGLAYYLRAVLQGMSVQAAAGADPAVLRALINTCLSLWPGK